MTDPKVLRPLFDAVYEMNAAKDHPDFMSAVAAGLARMIPADLCVVHVLDRTNGKLVHVMLPGNPFTPEEINYYAQRSHENPLVAHFERTGETCARRVSDVLSTKAWLKSPFYQNVIQRLGYNRFIGLPCKVDRDVVAGISFNRAGRDFTRRHCALLDAFAPHFRQAWKRHPDPWTHQSVPVITERARLAQLGLTARESDVAFWITEGKQNREIANILGLSFFTVQKHVANMLRKLQLENRHTLTIQLLRQLDKR